MLKKALWLLCCAGVMAGLFLSCEIPQALTIKGKPGVYIPLGDPLKDDDKETLSNYVSRNKIDEMMDNPDADKKITIYDYRGSDVDQKVQAYIVHYPIAEMKLDLEEYINDALNDAGDQNISYTLPPQITNTPSNQFPSDGYFLSNTGPQTTESTPLFTISLSDMAKLVKEVIGGPFGIELDLDNTSSFQEKVLVKIPAFGIYDYIEGKMMGGKLQFADTPEDGIFIPKKQSQGGSLSEKNELEIYVKVTGPCSGTIKPEMVFEWDSATVYTKTNDSLKGDYKSNFKNDLGEYLGEGVNLKEVTGYIYVNNVGDEATLSLSANGESLLPEEDSALVSIKTRPVFADDPFTELLPTPSHSPIHLTNVLNEDFILDYQIKIPEIPVSHDDKLKIITIDMVILLPLEFEVTSESSISGYVKLELNNIFPEPGKDDLFLRDSKDDGLLSNLASMTILFKTFQNEIIGGDISILVSSVNLLYPSDNFYRTFDFKQDGKLTLNMKDPLFPFPFTPEFGIVIKKDNPLSGSFFIKRQINPDTPGKFEFTLAVEAKADLNYTIDF